MFGIGKLKKLEKRVMDLEGIAILQAKKQNFEEARNMFGLRKKVEKLEKELSHVEAQTKLYIHIPYSYTNVNGTVINGSDTRNVPLHQIVHMLVEELGLEISRIPPQSEHFVLTKKPAKE